MARPKKSEEQLVAEGAMAYSVGDYKHAKAIFKRFYDHIDKIFGGIMLSRIYVMTNDVPAAEKILLDLLDEGQREGSNRVLHELIMLYNHFGQYEKAYDLCMKAYESGNKEELEQHVSCCVHLKKIEDAEKYALEALERGDQGAEIWLGEVYMGAGDWGRAVAYFSRLHEEGVDVSYQLGMALMNNDQTAEAIPHLWQAYEHGKLDALVHLAMIHVRMKDLRNAVVLGEQALRLGRGHARLVLGLAYFILDDYENAVQHWEAIAPECDIDVRPYARIATCYMHMMEFKKALKAIDKGIANGETDVWSLKGMICLSLGRYRVAKQCFLRSTEEDMDFVGQASLHLGRLFLEKGDKKSASQYFQDALLAGVLEGGVELGDIYFSDEDYESALRWYNQASDRGCATALERMASVYMCLKDYDKAREMYKRCIEQGDEASVHAGRLGVARVNIESGSLEEGERQFKDCIEAGIPQASEHYGRCLAGIGQFSKAACYLEDALMMDGTPAAAFRLYRVYRMSSQSQYEARMNEVREIAEEDSSIRKEITKMEKMIKRLSKKHSLDDESHE